MLNHAIGPSMAAQASKNGKEYNEKREFKRINSNPKMNIFRKKILLFSFAALFFKFVSF